MFEVVPKRTMPQGLLLLSALFSYAMIALNQLMLVAMPTYAMYGSQHYVSSNGTKSCDSHAPAGQWSPVWGGLNYISTTSCSFTASR